MIKYAIIFCLLHILLVPIMAQTGGDIIVHPHIQKQLFTDWGYDIKQPGKAVALSNNLINQIFIGDGMDVLRVPVYARDGHPAEGIVTDEAYTVTNDIIGAILRVKAIKPSVKIFASLRLEGPDTFQPWMLDGTGKVDSVQLAKMYRDYLVYMKNKGIVVDILGVDNEAEFNLGDITPAKYKNIVGRIKAYAAEGLFTVPEQFVAAENYGPNNAFNFINTLNNNNWRNTFDIAGTHYYPHLRPLINLENFVSVTGSKPAWNTEIHWDSKSDVDDDIEAEQGMIAMFDCIDVGMNGMTWWNYGTNNNTFRGQLCGSFVRSIVDSRPVDVDDIDGRTMEEVTKVTTRAFRSGNTINIWVINRTGVAYSQQLVRLTSGSLSSTPVSRQWINGANSTAGSVNAQSNTSFTVNIPASSFTLITCTINEETLPSFTKGNLLVVRSGYATNTLTANATAVMLDEYTASGAFVQSRQLSTDVFLLSGNNVNEGYATLSQNGQYLAIAGYAANLNEQNVTTSAVSVSKRTVAIINPSGTADYSTKFNSLFDANAVTGAVPSDDGLKIWVAGNGSSGTGGLYFVQKGASNGVKLISSNSNLRVPCIYNSQLYISGNSATLGQPNAYRLAVVGAGMPEIETTAANLTGADFNLSTSSGGVPVSIFQYAVLAVGGAQANVAYVANDLVSNPGIKKYVLQNGNWIYTFTIGDGLSRYRGLTATVNGNNVDLYAVVDNNKVIKVTDENAFTSTMPPTPSVILTAKTGTFLRGISFVPTVPLATSVRNAVVNKTILRVFPQPAQSFINIMHEAATPNNFFTLFSVEGKLIKTMSAAQGAVLTNLQTSDLKPGFYILQFSNGKETGHLKFQKL